MCIDGIIKKEERVSAPIRSTEICTIQGGSGLGGRGRRRWLDARRNSPNLHPLLICYLLGRHKVIG